MLKLQEVKISGPQAVRSVKFSYERTWRSPEFIVHPDEFGRPQQTLISPQRVNRPMPSLRVGTLGFDESLRLFNSNPGASGFDQRLHVARLTRSPAVLTHILQVEKEPQILTSAAANPHSPKELRIKGCAFCDFEKWGEPREKTEGLTVGWASNPYGFAPSHDVHIVIEPIHNLSEMVQSPTIARDFIRLAFLRARIMYEEFPRVTKNIFWGMNYGIGRIEDGEETLSSFATFQHLHAQMISVLKGMVDPGSRLKKAFSFKGDFLAEYLEALENNGLIIKKYADQAALVVPWSQESKHHLRIISPVRNFIEGGGNEQAVGDIGQAFFDALRILYSFEIKSFNCVSYPGPMSKSSQKLVIDVIPRARPAICEMMGDFVVDEFPIATAEKARQVLNIYK